MMTRVFLLAGMLSAILVFSCTGEELSKSLLSNGDFAQADKGGRPIAWKAGGNRYCAPEGARMEFACDPGVPFSEGFPAVKVTRFCPPGGKSEYSFQCEPFPIVHGKTYGFSVWLRAEAPVTIRLAFDGYSADLARKLGKDYRHWWSRPEGEARVDDQWREFSTTARIPGPDDAGYMTDMKSACVRLVSPNGTFWAAKASVVEVAGAATETRNRVSERNRVSGATYTYIPEETVGGIHAYVDDLRFLRASWKEVPLLHKWGELCTPITWGFRKGRAQQNVFQPDGLKEPITARLAPDVPVRVTRTAAGVEYMWSCSYLQSEFTPENLSNLTYPKRRALEHLQCDVKQVNRVEITRDRITLVSTLRFLNPPSSNLTFYPVLFPGTGRDRKYMPEFRISGKTCTAVNRRGETRDVAYPAERVAQVWLDDEPRSLLFDLENVGKVRYSFSFSDPNASLLFYAQTGWPTPSLNPYCCPAIVGKVVIPAKTGFRNGVYESTMRMEVLVGDAAAKVPDIAAAPARLPLDKPLDLRVATATPSCRFFTDDPLRFNLVVDGLDSEAHRNFTIETRVLDYENQEVNKQTLRLSLPQDIHKPLELALPPLGAGAYILDAKLLEGGGIVGAKAQRFCILDHPVEYPAEKSFFGCTNGFMRFPGKNLDDVKETASLLHDIGIKRLRWNEHWTVDWGMVEKEPGRYTFPEKFEKLEAVKAIGMDNFIAMGTFEGGANFMPAWARSGRKTLCDYDIPKDLKAYEDYCYEVAKRFKGLVNEFELENEPNYVHAKDTREMEDYLRTKADILSAAYRGIKRAQPDALVIGGTVGVSAFKDLEWLEALLKHAQARGLRMYDVMAPHYILRGTGRPEDYLENLKYARQLADRYGLVLWNGENGGPLGSFHNIYPNFTFQPDEKGYANGSMREYLLHKMYGVEHVNICFACEWVPPRGIFYFEYESCLAGRLYGAGGFLKPYAVAHAALARLLDGSRFEQQIDLRLKDGWCLVFKRGEETIVAAWMVDDKATWNVALPDGVTYMNIVGGAREIGGPQRLTVSGEPLYLVAKGEAGEKLVSSIRESRLVPDTLIGIEHISFAPDRKGFDVQLRNYTGAPLKLDSITLSTGKPPAKLTSGRPAGPFGGPQVTLTNAALTADDVQTVRFTPPAPVQRSAMIAVTAVVSGKSYGKEEFVFYPSLESARASGYLIATKAKAAVVVDGDLSEWSEGVPIVLNRKDQVTYADMKAEDLGGWKGPDDLSAVGYVMWDEANLYFACKVTDDKYANPFTDGMFSTWKCDSIQMAFDPLSDDSPSDVYYNDDDQEINLALTAKGPAYWRRTFGKKFADRVAASPDGQVPGAKLAVRMGTDHPLGLSPFSPRPVTMIYEFGIPIKELYPLQVRPGATVRFNFIVNDDDGGGRAKWIGITPGIGERKAPYLFKRLYFAE